MGIRKITAGLLAAGIFAASAAAPVSGGITVKAAAAGSSVFYSELKDGEVTITGVYSMESADLVIPESIGGYPVVSVADNAFFNKAVTSVSIPGSVKYIGDNAFGYCEGLESVKLSSGVETIGQGAFFRTALKSVDIPASVTDIGSGAFDDIKTLAAINVDKNNKAYRSDGGVLFSAENELIKYPAAKAGASYDIPAGTVSLRSSAFYGCKNLVSVSIPEGIDYISVYAFNSCYGLKSVSLPESLKEISLFSFAYCRSLESVTIPPRVSKIDSSSFIGCYGLKKIDVSEKNVNFRSEDGVLYKHDLSALVLYPSAREGALFVVPDGVKKISNSAFAGCQRLSSVILPDTVSLVESYAFSFCYALKSVTVPEKTTLLEYSFNECGGITLYGAEGSPAETFAKENGIDFIAGEAPVPAGSVTVYRLYNPVNLEHLFTTDFNEVVTLASEYGWNYEGRAWCAPAAGVPVYRLYCTETNAHLYTSDTNEVKTLLENPIWSIDKDGEPMFYSDSKGAVAIYRVYHEGVRRHLLTINETEYEVLTSSGWNAEGVKFYCAEA